MINTSEIALLEYKAPGSFEETRYEKLHNVIVDSSSEGSLKIAHTIARLIIEKHDQDQMCVLGLATGSSPLSVYRELVRLHKEEGLSFKKCNHVQFGRIFSALQRGCPKLSLLHAF